MFSVYQEDSYKNVRLKINELIWHSLSQCVQHMVAFYHIVGVAMSVHLHLDHNKTELIIYDPNVVLFGSVI